MIDKGKALGAVVAIGYYGWGGNLSAVCFHVRFLFFRCVGGEEALRLLYKAVGRHREVALGRRA